MSNRAIKKERQRCVNILAAHRERIHLKAGGAPRNQKILLKIVQLLKVIEREMLDIKQDDLMPDTPQYHGDFSAEEMERALLVMEEQDQRNNPFEG